MITLPRLFELRGLIEDPTSPSAYFQNFDNNWSDSGGCREACIRLEAALGELDANAWQFLRTEALPCLVHKDPVRGWQQLFDVLNQAHAYNYLRRLQCSAVQFIPRSPKQKTPDIEEWTNRTHVVCEAKTINISDDEARAPQRTYRSKHCDSAQRLLLWEDSLHDHGGRNANARMGCK